MTELSSTELHELRAKAEQWDDHVRYGEIERSIDEERTGVLAKTYDRGQLETILAGRGWRLTHFAAAESKPGRSKPEKYSAVKDEVGALQSAGKQDELLRRCASWDLEQERRKPAVAPRRKAAVPASDLFPASDLVSA